VVSPRRRNFVAEVTIEGSTSLSADQPHTELHYRSAHPQQPEPHYRSSPHAASRPLIMERQRRRSDFGMTRATGMNLLRAQMGLKFM
jgi:hypothetical protein